MDELCFIYPRETAASSVADELGELHPDRPRARVDARHDSAVVHLATEVWDQRLVPEIVLGLGGRLIACEDPNESPPQ
jgi:hypothetical protein